MAPDDLSACIIHATTVSDESSLLPELECCRRYKALSRLTDETPDTLPRFRRRLLDRASRVRSNAIQYRVMIAPPDFYPTIVDAMTGGTFRMWVSRCLSVASSRRLVTRKAAWANYVAFHRGADPLLPQLTFFTLLACKSTVKSGAFYGIMISEMETTK